MTQPTWPPTALAAFVTRWQSAGGAERANYQLFLTELCDVMGVPHPDPTTSDDSRNNYVFDRAITVTNPDGTTTTNFIDLYHHAHFVLETKTRHRSPLPCSPRDSPGVCLLLSQRGSPLPATHLPPLKRKRTAPLSAAKTRTKTMALHPRQPLPPGGIH